MVVVFCKKLPHLQKIFLFFIREMNEPVMVIQATFFTVVLAIVSCELSGYQRRSQSMSSMMTPLRKAVCYC